MTTRTRYGALTVQLTPGPYPVGGADMPLELRVVEHRVGYSEVQLENGDVIRCYLFVDKMEWQPEQSTFAPVYRVVPEVLKRGWHGLMQPPRETWA